MPRSFSLDAVERGLGYVTRCSYSSLKDCSCKVGCCKHLNGGESRIRTHGGLSTLDGFQDRYLNPLGHLSKLSMVLPQRFELRTDMAYKAIALPTELWEQI